MGFYATSFSFNGLPSELFNLSIANTGDGSSSNEGSGNVEIKDIYLWKKMKPYFLGIGYTTKTSFPVTFYSKDEITAPDLQAIQNWLFGHLSYKTLSIIQPDMDSYFFKCIFNEPTVLRHGNVIYGIGAVCQCDSQFAWTYEKTDTYTYASPPLSGTSITFYNTSNYKGYLYPTLTFRLVYPASAGNVISIVNTSEDNRTSTFTGLSSYEVITMNNELGIITSSFGLRRLSTFNKNFVRFVPGVNNLTVTGPIDQFTITYQFARQLGG